MLPTGREPVICLPVCLRTVLLALRAGVVRYK